MRLHTTPYHSVLNSLILDCTPLIRTTKSSPYIDIYFPYRKQVLETGSIKTVFASRPPSKTALQACNLGPSCSRKRHARKNKKIRGTEYDFSQSSATKCFPVPPRFTRSVFFPNQKKYDPIPISITKQYSVYHFFFFAFFLLL